MTGHDRSQGCLNTLHVGRPGDGDGVRPASIIRGQYLRTQAPGFPEAPAVTKNSPQSRRTCCTIENGSGRKTLRWVIVAAIMFGTHVVSESAAAEDAPSLVTVVDGDTLEMGGRTVRLYGIDAPELGQLCLNGSNRYRCGYEAALMLKKLVGNGLVSCRPTPADSEDAGQICSVGLVDLAEAMLRRGYAVAQPNALTVYRKVEQDAKQGRLGIWRGEFILPSDWRAGQRLQARSGEPGQLCDIKGIVSDKGEKVYLVPIDPDYEAIEIDQSRGEKLFCSDDEAELSGWRRWPKSAVQQRSTVKINQSN